MTVVLHSENVGMPNRTLQQIFTFVALREGGSGTLFNDSFTWIQADFRRQMIKDYSTIYTACSRLEY